jgi:preprotein translocase subunit YajC
MVRQAHHERLIKCPSASSCQEKKLFISEAYAQSTGGSPGTPDITFMALMIGMFGLVYFISIRPQMKRAKEHKGMLESLKTGDEVIVLGGVLGKITKIGDVYMDIEIAPNTQIHVQKSAVQTMLPKGTIKSIN